MKITILLSAIFLFFIFKTKAQTEPQIRYLDGNFMPVEQKKASYTTIYLVNKLPDGNWEVRDYYAHSGKLRILSYFTDSALTQRAGPFQTFYEDNKIQTRGFYSKNIKVGDWKSWHTNGKISDSVHFDLDGKITGIRLGWFSDGMISDSSIYDNGGKGVYVSWHRNGTKKGEGSLDGEKKIGKWIFYRNTGIKAAEEFYLQDSLASIQCFDDKGKPSVKDCFFEKEAEFAKGMNAWLNYIAGRVSAYSENLEKNKSEGTVQILFIIDVDGKIIEAKVENPTGNYLEEVAVNIIRNSPRWSPAIQHNMPVKAYRRQPISYQLSEE